ncbi:MULTISPECIES: alpha/beta hydrolase-fold protein [unclassified Leeuwenhoekiella]|uniref:alpha/beta hydrolase-fold protein n=1 Tax=unclassified Leeuwenhoekiella TaxID=2615029 RepID=UPI000C679932|nr:MULTISPECIES: alpha/beta hydrolase-fold protein [unclassified Leeuwenhoekiella]MAW94798.1 esterase [Leeuwenhoekiella sp.]MBA79518.1 esterase [Leeuwenhoekiella sp.]|tara:strand:- start:57696 stop:58835 length:1140 start_codon:yes stop_codon:yes gene_type:complete
MKTLQHIRWFVLLAGLSLCQAQEGYKLSSVNQQGKAFPQVNEEGQVRAQILAPEATSVKLDIGGVKYEMTKDAEGVWTGESAPQDVGFHYYQLNIDGASVPDPGTQYFYGAGRWGSGIEIPAADDAIFALRKVPHGKVVENLYFSEITREWRRNFIYLPPGYMTSDERYPVLYLQHGSFEDETGWSSQGHANLILDNLIADGEAEPMIIVMDNGYAYKPDAPMEGRPESVFEEVMLNEIIPMTDKQFRTVADREHRAIAGLSMGANQTMRILMNNLGTFSYYGGFSGTSNYPSSDPIDVKIFLNGAFADGKAVDDQLNLFWLGLGTKEPSPFPKSVGAFKDMLDQQGINYSFYESPGTAHEWHTWRRCLYEYAQQLFKE